jgi:hypothetical protein
VVAIALENGPFIDDFPIKTSIYKGYSMAILITRWYRQFLLFIMFQIIAI